MVVQGQVVVDAAAPAFFDATLRVQVLDVTEQDAPAAVVAETRQVVSHRVGRQDRFTFELECDQPGAGERYDLAAHVDLNGNGEVEAGDLVTTASHALPPPCAAEEVALAVREVG